MKRFAPVFLLVLAPAASADEIFLRAGGRINGQVVSRTATSIVIDMGAGQVTLPMSRVEKVVDGPSFLAIYRERAATLAPNDVAGWLALAEWARDRELHTLARDAFARVATLDPANPVAQRALGRVLHGDRWMTPEESYRARGYVHFQGSWMAPEERDSILREREAHSQAVLAEKARVEAEARAREAEARARTAEAEARRAEAALKEQTGGGIPLSAAYGTGVYSPYGVVVGPYGVAMPSPFCGFCGFRHAAGACSRRPFGVPPRQRPHVVQTRPSVPAWPVTSSITQPSTATSRGGFAADQRSREGAAAQR